MTDFTSIDDTTTGASPDDDTAAAPARRPRRRAASRPAGPPVHVDDIAGDAPASAEAPPTAASAPPDRVLPVQKPARKRAPRKSAAASSRPQDVADTPLDAEPADDRPADPVNDLATTAATLVAATQPPADAAQARTRPAAKKAVRKRAARAASADQAVESAVEEQGPGLTGPPTEPLDSAVTASLAGAVEPEEDAEEDPSAQGVAPRSAAPVVAVPVLFQAPDPAAAAPRHRRRASAPAGPPVAHDDDVDTGGGPPVGSDTPSSVDPTTSDIEPDAAGQTADGRDDDGIAEDATGTARKRRRRGGRGRRPRTDEEVGPEGGPVEDTEADDAVSPAQDDDADQGDGEDETGSASSRRRRRRRRSGGGSGSGDGAAEASDDPPGTVTKVRTPRRAEDEVASVRGSTRLEAKKQRRRDGRESGRRKPVITESEFLARRESVERSMVVRETAGRTQIAVLEDGVLVEHYVANETNASMIGNVYLGKVQNVLPSMEAAFVDIGRGRNAVLYAGEVNWDAAGLEGQPRRIELALKSGDTVLVQVTKDPMGHKGARLTSQVSLPGRYLVYVPGSTMTGISRKLPDTERSRLKRILKAVVPEKAGVIVRTAAEGASEDELSLDVERLTEQWAQIERLAGSSSGGPAPKLLYGEPDLTIRVVRDVFNEDFGSLLVSGEGAWGVVQPYLTHVAPDLADRVTRWTQDKDVFAEHRIDEQLLKAMDRKVWLPSGGSLVIDRTEAMTVVDVNTGKFIGAGGNLEETVTRNNLEAAEEVVRQLRLRDIGGIIVVDFIDMVLEGNRDLVLRRLLECLGRDRTKHQVAEVTSLGLVQMTRKRVGQGLLEVFSEPCEHCQGRGVIVHAEPVERPANGSGTSASGPSGSAGSGRRGRGGRGGDAPSAVAVEPPPVRQSIPAGFVASLVHHDVPAAPSSEQPGSEGPSVEEPSIEGPSVEEPSIEGASVEGPSVEQPSIEGPSIEGPSPGEPSIEQPSIEQVDSSRPARRRRRASAPTGPPRSHG